MQTSQAALDQAALDQAAVEQAVLALRAVFALPKARLQALTLSELFLECDNIGSLKRASSTRVSAAAPNSHAASSVATGTLTLLELPVRPWHTTHPAFERRSPHSKLTAPSLPH